MPSWQNRSVASKLTVMSVITISYFMAGKIGLGFASIHVSASPVWAPAGIAVAVFLLLGFQLWPSIFVGAFLVNVTTAGSILTSGCIAAGNTLEAVLGAWLLQRWAGGLRAFDSPNDVFRFAILAGLLSPTVSATIGVTSLTLAGIAPQEQYTSIWWTWWLGDATGILIVTPALVLWAANPRLTWKTSERIELVMLLLVLVATCELIFGAWLGTAKHHPLQFVLVPVLIWAAFRFSPRETATLSVVLAAWAAWGTMNGRGPFTSESENEGLLLGQVFLGVNTVMALGLAAAVQEREQADARMHETAERLVKERTEELRHIRARLRAMAQEVTLTEQRERKRMATELHDYLAQLLVLAKMKLEQVPAQTKALGAPVVAMIGEIEETLTQALTYTRTLMAELHPSALHELGLPMALEGLAEEMKKHHLRVDVQLRHTKVPLTESQAVLLYQSARELLINAAKHAGTNKASVTLELQNEVLRIAVQDKGTGFNPDWLETERPGQRFGLFSVKERMEELGGWCRIDSAPGKGTTITLELPLNSATLSPMQPVNGREGAPPGQPVNVRRVLLVDDHAMVRQGIRAMLDAYPSVVIIGEAADGREAVSIARKRMPDVVIMDINMPGMNGIEATRLIKQERPETKIIAVSVNNTSQVREAMQNAGASAFVSKDEVCERLYETIMGTISMKSE